MPAHLPDLEALAAEVADFLDDAPVAETMAARLLAVVSELLRFHADAMTPQERPGH